MAPASTAAKKSESEPVEYSITFSTTTKDIADLFGSAYGNCGIGYWARVELRDSQKPWDATIIEIDEDTGKKTKHKFSLEKLLDGFRVAATKYPQHFADWVKQDYDGTTADVIVQCALFGEIKYG